MPPLQSGSRQGALWIAKLLAASTSILAAVLLIEGYVRVSGQDRPLVWQPHPVLGWWHVPGSAMRWTDEGDGLVEINSQGLRDVERSVAKPAGVFRVAVFGDSMTEGVQVDLLDTYTQVLESLLRKRGLQAEVLNFGVNGYSPLQGYLLYRHAGRSYDPDLVLHAIFLDNDVADSHRELATGQIGAPYVLPGDQVPPVVAYERAEASHRDYGTQPIHTVRRWSAIYRMLSIARWQRLEANRLGDAAAANASVPQRYRLYSDPLPEKWKDAWHTLERIETALAREVRKEGRAFALVSVPAGQVVSERAWRTLLERHPSMAAERWDLSDPENRFRTLAAFQGIPLIAPTECFKLRSEREPLFYGSVGHFTPAGHRLMAEILDHELGVQGLLPAGDPRLESEH